jgi:DNA polymerase elongation subunit (family B)
MSYRSPSVERQGDDNDNDYGEGDTIPISFSVECVDWNDRSKRPHDYIELTGSTSEGKSIKVDVDFKQYFYLKLPDDTKEEDADNIMNEIRGQLGWQAKSIIDYKYEEKIPARPFQFGRKFKLLKLIFQKMYGFRTIFRKLQNYQDENDPTSVPGTILINNKREAVIMFETDIRPIDRFCQTCLNSSGWMVCTNYTELPTDKDSDVFVPGGVLTDMHIKTQLQHLSLEPNDIKAQSIPAYTTLSVDIETSSLDPNSGDAAVYQISQYLFDSRNFTIRPCLFTWNPHVDGIDRKRRSGPTSEEKFRDIVIDGAEVVNCASEKECLQLFVNSWRQLDPSNLVGHNFYGFDLNYLITRAKFYEIEEFEYLGRTGTKNREPKKNMNRREVAYCELPGRLQIDTMFFLMGYDKPQTSYSLESCCDMHLKNIPAAGGATQFHANIVKQFATLPVMLTKNKGEIAGKDITKYFYSENYEKRRELAIYCLKDSLLTLRLFVERLVFMKLYKMGQAFRAPIQVIMTSGKQEQVMPNILTQMYKQNILYNKYHDPSLDPYAELWPWQKYGGGLVRAPKKGKYLKPVAVLDFGGMYPSIMMEYKVCMQTMIPLKRLNKDELVQLSKYKHITKVVNGVEVAIIQEPGVGFSFVIQENMKTCRAAAKDRKAAAKDEFTKSIYECEQLAYKLYMNGMYGLFAPVQGGKFTYLLVAAAITQFGRELSEEAGQFVLKKLEGKNPAINYGDTDSLMYSFDYPTDEFKTENDMMQYAFKINLEIADQVSKHFKSEYISIALEKIYYPMCLYDKKKYYAGRKWPGLDKNGKVLPPYPEPDVVGIEGKKRDRCEDLRELQYRIINLLLVTKSNEDEIESEIFKSLMKIAEGKVPLEKFIIVKGLSKDIEGYGGRKLPHVAVATRNKNRGNLDSCKKGARISYIVYTDEKKYKGERKGGKWGVSDYCEDAMYASSKKLHPDPRYYIEQHYAKALKKLLAPCNIDADKLYAKPMALALRTSNIGQTAITDFMKRDIKIPLATVKTGQRFANAASSTASAATTGGKVKQTALCFSKLPGSHPIFVKEQEKKTTSSGKRKLT